MGVLQLQPIQRLALPQETTLRFWIMTIYYTRLHFTKLLLR